MRASAAIAYWALFNDVLLYCGRSLNSIARTIKTPERVTQKIPKISLPIQLVYMKPTNINKAIRTTLNN
ncbi:MAG: hypothetical protein DK302_001200 [Chloroflexi bacterium]|jgi:hypothetical protein|nr:MAG: hypothetical protein DK302_001200 [Chloroflexota bacterium]